MMSARVAIIGGGISGLACGMRLGQLGINDVTVFDKGRTVLGGRSSSREVRINGERHIFDHGCQYFTASDKRFTNLLASLHQHGVAKVWNGRVGRLNTSGEFEETPTQKFIGTDGLQSIIQYLAKQVRVQPNTNVEHVVWESEQRKWKVDQFGHFEYLVVAHYGKYTDKLMSSAGVPDIHGLLCPKYGDTLQDEPCLQLSPMWALMVAFPQSLGLPYEGVHVQDPDIAWIGNNTSKYKSSDLECWTVLSTKKFGAANKVERENLTQEKTEQITEQLLQAFSKTTGLEVSSLNPCFSKTQLWGAALPMNVLDNGEDCVFDGAHKVGLCGDWLTKPCIEGAAVSGLSLAEKISQDIQGIKSDTSLTCKFKPTESESIGAFPAHPDVILSC